METKSKLSGLFSKVKILIITPLNYLSQSSILIKTIVINNIMPKHLNTQTFIERSILKHGNRYDYKKSIFVISSEKITITCLEHGDFLLFPYHHYVVGRGCKTCKFEEISKERSSTLEEFINKANIVHGYKYDYSKSIYLGANNKIEIICPTHGSFWTTPSGHTNNKVNCLKCSILHRKKSNKQFIKECKLVRPEYNYDKTQYVNNKTKCTIICYSHGDFEIYPNNILFYNYGCPTCYNNTNASNTEKLWLNSLNVPERQKTLIMSDGTRYLVDGFDPDTNTVYEFWGDFWHGNPKNSRFNTDETHPVRKITFKELYENTLIKKYKIIENGFKLIDIWESDFLKK